MLGKVILPLNNQRVVLSATRSLSSQKTVAPLTSLCNSYYLCSTSSNIVNGTNAAADISATYKRRVSSSSAIHQHISCSHATTYAPTTLKNINRYKSSTAAIIPPEEEPAMGESLDESGYLGMILNARVYDVAVETELQHAKSLSKVSVIICGEEVIFVL